MGLQQVILFPQFPKDNVFISLIKDLDENKLENIKQQLIVGNPDYDYCFLNTNHIASLEHLYFGIHKAILNKNSNNMKAKALNTEIMLNLSPINNIMDAIKRFGIDTSCPNVICIQVTESENVSEDSRIFNKKILELMDADENDSIALTDEVLLKNLNVQKFKKLYKLNDIKFEDSSKLQKEFTKLAIGACLSK